MTALLNSHSLEALRQDLLREQTLATQLAAMLVQHAGDAAAADCDLLSATAQAAQQLAEQIARWADMQPLKIAIVGDYSAGKSSFINHLLEDDALCPIRDDPTTSHVTLFRFGKQERIVSTTAAGRATTLSRETYTQQVQASSTARTRGRPRRFTITVPVAILDGVELLDTPGFNNLHSAVDTEATEAVLGEVDAVLFLVDVNTGTIPDSGVERLRKIRELLPEAPIRVVFSKADAKAPSRLRVLKDDCQQRHGALFHGAVLAYSTRDLGSRPDIASRTDIGQLMQAMRAERRAGAERTLAQCIHLHILERHRLLQRLAPGTHRLMATQSARVGHATTAKVRLLQRFEQLKSHMEPEYRSEVRDALHASFRVEEISGSGWIFKDARIVRNAPTLPAALTTFKSVRKIRERLCSDISALVHETTKVALASAGETCRRATADTAGVAEKRMERDFGHLFNRRFDYDTLAREKMWQALGEHVPAVAGALWDEWVRWIDGLYELLDEQHLMPLVEDAQAQMDALRALMDAYQELPTDAVSAMIELA